MDKQVRFETSGALGILTLANPPLNLFSEELIADLRSAVTAAKQTPLRAVLVRAEGKIFSGGADVRIFKGRTAAHARERVTSHLRTIADLEELPYPTLAAVQGLCLAAGLELALACDLIWAGASARFAQAEASIGTTTLLGGVQRLAERAGPEPCPRDHLYRRRVRRGDVRTMEHRQPHCSRRRSRSGGAGIRRATGQWPYPGVCRRQADRPSGSRRRYPLSGPGGRRSRPAALRERRHASRRDGSSRSRPPSLPRQGRV